jgi:hypothetical protein
MFFKIYLEVFMGLIKVALVIQKGQFISHFVTTIFWRKFLHSVIAQMDVLVVEISAHKRF